MSTVLCGKGTNSRNLHLFSRKWIFTSSVDLYRHHPAPQLEGAGMDGLVELFSKIFYRFGSVSASAPHQGG